MAFVSQSMIIPSVRLTGELPVLNDGMPQGFHSCRLVEIYKHSQH